MEVMVGGDLSDKVPVLLNMAAATKNIDKSVYVLEKFLVHRARSRRPKGASY